ncbi:unnamed protein product [Brachionus calyciflorus]|uniref:MULE transposase domain-containing protein n=1 Tax=Brachionus calyciflorus TaxID=104777 RepID=A0A813NSC0_9BILA|nr:unnamed protein product [Brachionus calyciflorus]
MQFKRYFFHSSKITSSLTTVVEGKNTKFINEIDNFLIYKTKRNKKLVFCSKIGLEILSKSTEWHADGTFHVATKYYHQLYIIQAWFKGRMILCTFITDYEDVLKALKRPSNKNNLILNPQKVMTDLELAAINPFKKQFPSILNKSCFFHFAQALFKKFVKLGFKNDYGNNKEVNMWFRRLFCFSVIPITNISDQFELIMKTQPIFLEENL